MIISDLNHLEVIEETNLVGGIDNLYAATNLSFKETVDISKLIKSVVVVYGNASFAEADAKAYGPNTVAQGLTYTTTVAGHSSQASSTSVSGTNGYYFSW